MRLPYKSAILSPKYLPHEIESLFLKEILKNMHSGADEMAQWAKELPL